MRSKCSVIFAGILLAWICAAVAQDAALPAAPLSWTRLLDQAAADPALSAPRKTLLAKARELAALPIIRRANKLEEIGQHRTWLDGRSNALEDEIRETFALAMSDFAACNTLAGELPVLAAAYRLTRETAFLDRVIAQLDETASWSPLQRPGWTLYSPGHRFPADGKDGNWLATGCGVRALADTIEILPENSLDPALLQRVQELLEAEITGVVEDWQVKRPWFVRSDNPITNQWVLPTEGLIRACLFLGREKHASAYELGVANLLKSLDAHGAHGEFEEGFGYASFTVTSMLHAARAMAAAGDPRAVDHPFLKHFPTWLVHHFQPGNMVINCFDAGGAYDAAKSTRPLLSLLAVCTASPVARWALAYQAGGPSDDLPGLAARALPPVGAEAAPPLFAYYERATRVNWRDSWDKNGAGVWVRGGHPLDQHDHQDRGHVNFIAKGRPLLIEAGTPAYHHQLMMTHYATGVGHNVLQLGTAFPERLGNAGEYVTYPGWQKRGGVAPITVNRLDAAGGDITVDGTACYDRLAKWRRSVTWNSTELEVHDEVILDGDAQDIILFRWHLGTEESVAITGEGTRFTATWSGAAITLESSAPLTVSQIPMPDHTLAGHTGDEDPGNVHTCLTVQLQNPQNTFTLTTKIK